MFWKLDTKNHYVLEIGHKKPLSKNIEKYDNRVNQPDSLVS
jgi:hypothetical protein